VHPRLSLPRKSLALLFKLMLAAKFAKTPVVPITGYAKSLVRVQTISAKLAVAVTINAN
jgi:hypothetical protein